jgi:NAD+ synthase (glutamine-hydrolysing)
MKIGVAQINTSVGDIKGNREKIIKYILQAEKNNCDLVIFPECATTGYPQKDLLYNPAFIDGNTDTIVDIINLTKTLNVAVVIGFVDIGTQDKNFCIYNAVTVIHNGNIEPAYHKHLLPNYNVFDERRYFEPGIGYRTYKIKDMSFSIIICEDMWCDEYKENPIFSLSELTEAQDRPQFIINISASPFSADKEELRKAVLQKRFAESHIPILYVNQVGAQDGLIFDGGSMFINNSVKVTQVCQFFVEEFRTISFENKNFQPLEDYVSDRFVYLQKEETREIYKIHDALVLGIRDYFRKSGFEKAVIGLSGGIDSAVTCALAVEALGPENVLGVLMPSPYSSRGSIDDALALAYPLGIKAITINIDEFIHVYNENLHQVIFGGNYKSDVTEQNIQARIRGNILMAISNEEKRLVLSTGNKSEMSVGYCTLYGDMCGGLSVLSDVYKENVYKLARFINELYKNNVIPQNSITKPPSAELKPDQKDTDSLPPYEILDGILKQLIERKKSYVQILKKGYQPETVKRIIRMVDLNEYKRQQAAPGLIISERDLTVGRRMPINNGFKI